MKKQILYSGTFENLDLHSEEVTDTLIIARAARFFAYSEEAGHLSGVPELAVGVFFGLKWDDRQGTG
jgi:hypothetical protein